jgi:AcrR family transcriptional regulator
MARRASEPGAGRAGSAGGVRVARERPVGGGVSRTEVADIQRSRLLAGAVGAIEEVGYAQTTVGQITARARVSRRTFYELFANREECLEAVLEDVVGMVEAELAAAGLGRLGWREQVRMGLHRILVFFDREPALARVCVVQALRAGPRVVGRREAILARLAGVVDEGRGESARGAECGPLIAEGLVGAAFSIVYARLFRGEGELTGLLGELMGMIVLPYLGPAAARREQSRAVSVPLSAPPRERTRLTRSVRDPLEGVQMRLTYRTARVLAGVAEHPGASNRLVGDYAEVPDPGQISKLLRRLEGLGLLANTGAGHASGEPNAWTLTTKGERVAQSLRLHGGYESRAA